MKEKLKYVLLGDANSGKTAFANAFTVNSFSEQYQPTIGVDFSLVRMPNEKYDVQLWDTSGQNKFKTITESCKKDTKVFVVMFDLTRMESFNHAKKEIESLKQSYADIPIILVGTKSDLKNQIKEEEITNFNVDDQYHYIATSAKNEKNILSVLTKGMELHNIKNNLLTEDKCASGDGGLTNTDLSETDSIPVSIPNNQSLNEPFTEDLTSFSRNSPEEHEDNDYPLKGEEVNEKVPVSSSSLALKISFGVLASLAGSAAIIIGAIAIAAILTAIAPPIGIAMIVGGAAALLTGVGLFGSAASAHKKNKQLINDFNNIFSENMI